MRGTMAKMLPSLLLLLAALLPAAARADDGYRLWLRYDPIEAPQRALYSRAASELVVEGDSATIRAARSELVRGLTGLLGRPQPVAQRVNRDGAILLARRPVPTGEEGY